MAGSGRRAVQVLKGGTVCRVLFSLSIITPASAAFSGLQFKPCLVVELQKAVVLSLNFITLYQEQTDMAVVKMCNITGYLEYRDTIFSFFA